MKSIVKASTILLFLFVITTAQTNAPTTWTPELQVKTRGSGAACVAGWPARRLHDL